MQREMYIVLLLIIYNYKLEIGTAFMTQDVFHVL